MAAAQHVIRFFQDGLAVSSLRHALDVVSEVTQATVVLFDHEGHALIGPAVGNLFIRHLTTTKAGQDLILSAHRSVIPDQHGFPATDSFNPLAHALDHFAIPIIRKGQRAGTMTLGDRPQQPIPAETISAIAAAAELEPHDLQASAVGLSPWSHAEASAARNMVALIAELFADLCIQEENLNHRIEELTAVYNIAGLVAGTVDLQEVLDKTAETVCDVMKVKACSIRLLDKDTGNLEIRSVSNLSRDYLKKGPVNIRDNPIDAAAVAGETVYIENAPADPRTRYPQQAHEEGIVSGLVTGLIHRGKAVGVLRVYTGQPHAFTSFEESLLRAVASQAAAAIVNAKLLAETLEAERYARQLEYAGEVQRRMIPHNPPAMDHVEIGAVYRPIFEVGGDLYDFIKLPKGNLGFAVADVSGKGVPASLLMASLKSALRVHVRFTYHIERVMARLNRHVCRETTIGEFITAFYGVLGPDGRRLTYCSAGQDPPMLLRDGRVRYLGTGGMVLGVDPDATFTQELVDLEPGDVLLLYTDGAVEALNFNEEQYGKGRLAESLTRYADQPASRIAKNILWDLRRFRGLADRTDDVTLVVLKIR